MKQISILGGTGTIGDNMLDLLRQHNQTVRLFGVSAYQNIEKLKAIITEFQPSYAAIPSSDHGSDLKSICDKTGTTLLVGDDAIAELASLSDADLVVAAIVGMAGLSGVIAAIKAGHDIALANKESLVSAGHIVMPMLAQYNARIIPVDSEHNAIYQCLMGQNRDEVTKITLTASGGPFRSYNYEQLQKVTKADALRHPNWVMGAKVSIDSATLMNKGLELIEAAHLFNASSDDLSAVIHPQSLVHGMVDFKDGSMIAHLATADMRLPLGFALGGDTRINTGLSALDLISHGRLDFAPINEADFACYALARQVIDDRDGKAAILNAANEVAVEAFLANEISFLAIAAIVEETLAANLTGEAHNLDGLLALDETARQHARMIIKNRI